jgi:hypothetical protein
MITISLNWTILVFLLSKWYLTNELVIRIYILKFALFGGTTKKGNENFFGGDETK